MNGTCNWRASALADLFFGDKPAIDEHAAQLAAAALLFFERLLELVCGQQLLLEKNFAESNFFRTCPSTCIGCG